MTQPIVKMRSVASDIRMRGPRHLELLGSCQSVLSSIGINQVTRHGTDIPARNVPPRGDIFAGSLSSHFPQNLPCIHRGLRVPHSKIDKNDNQDDEN